MADQQGKLTQGAGTLSKGAQATNECKTSLLNVGNQLDSNLAGVVWHGSGATAFKKLQLDWHEKQQQIVKILDHFEASLHGSEKRTTSTDEQNSSHIGTYTSKLGDVPV